MSNHNAVAHNWAHKTGKCTKGFNVFYEGDTIYSYGYTSPIARHAVDAHGKPCILVTTRGYSVSTAKHKTYVRRAIPDGVTVHMVDNVLEFSSATTQKAIHKENYSAMLESINESLSKASRARTYASMHMNDSEITREQANAYSKAFKLGFRAIPQSNDIKAQLEAIATKEREQKRLQDAKEKEAIKDWQEGRKDHAPHTRIPYIRIKDEIIETSYGVKVALSIRTLAIYRLAKQCARRERAFTPSKVHKIDNWRLDAITQDGAIKAGCHLIPLSIQRRALELAGLSV